MTVIVIIVAMVYEIFNPGRRRKLVGFVFVFLQIKLFSHSDKRLSLGMPQAQWKKSGLCVVFHDIQLLTSWLSASLISK